MKKELNHVFSLLTSSEENQKVANLIMKGNPALKEEVMLSARPVLKELKMKSLKGIVNLAKKIENKGQLTKREQNAVALLPFLFDRVEYYYISKEKELPPILSDFRNLSSVELNWVTLRTFPNWFGKLTRLESLKAFSCNHLKSFNKAIGGLEQLKYLSWNYGRLEEITKHIGDLKCLKELYLKSNSIKRISNHIGNLQQLEHLNLNGNFIQKLPNSIGNLNNLKTLVLSHNNLHKLPTTIGNLKKLENLSLSFNAISSLPEEIKELINLKTLDIIRNPISESEKDRLSRLLPNCSIKYKFDTD